MLRIKIELNGAGLLRRVQAVGHVELAPKGSDTVCAAASVLLRTAARTLEQKRRIGLSGEAPKPGEFWIEIDDLPEDLQGWIGGVADALLRGLSDLAAEYPDRVSVQIEYS